MGTGAVAGQALKTNAMLANNPFANLMMGILATDIVQSSLPPPPPRDHDQCAKVRNTNNNNNNNKNNYNNNNNNNNNNINNINNKKK
jgi:hypothetical protein